MWGQQFAAETEDTPDLIILWLRMINYIVLQEINKNNLHYILMNLAGIVWFLLWNGDVSGVH